MKSQRLRFCGSCTESVAHELGPQLACRPKLCDFLKHIVVGVEEERQTRCELIGCQTSSNRRLDICDAMRQREGKFLNRGGPRFANVIPGDRNRVPSWRVFVTPGKRIDRQTHRRLRWKDVVTARGVFFED